MSAEFDQGDQAALGSAPTGQLSRRRVLLSAAAGTGALTVGGLATAIEASADFNWPTRLQRGDTGNAVRALQRRVAGFAASDPTRTYVVVDGIFGDQTYWAVRRFQSAWNLTVDGIAGPQTFGQINWIDMSDGSTRHFSFSEFYSGDGSGFGGGKIRASLVKRNVRRMMWKLEAMRRKAGNNPITINSGFRSVSYNSQVGGTPNSHHMYGNAADINIYNRSPHQECWNAATAGFSGIIEYSSHAHVDSRAEYSYGEGPRPYVWRW